jgi:protein SCO1
MSPSRFAIVAVAGWLALLPAAAYTQQGKLSAAERDAQARKFFTDTALETHTGRPVKFYSDTLRGKVVLVNFVFTQCGDACPLITAKLVQAKRELGDAFGRDVRFVSISLDPDHDRPEDLARFARKFDAFDPGWLFLTGEKVRVDAIVKRLGASTEDLETHSTAIIVGSPQQARWRKIRPDAPARHIAEQLREFVGWEAELRKTAQAVPPAGGRLP